jgi:hypothetical protein
MNKLLIPNGGMPLEGDDFRWEQDGVRDALKGILHYFSAPHGGNIILSGCQITLVSGNAVVTEGYALINHEVCYVPAQTVAVSSLANSSLKILETYDVSGLEVFADSVSRDTYAIRRGIVSDGLAGSNEIVLATPIYLADLLGASVTAMTSPVSSFQAGFAPNSLGVAVNKVLNQVLFQGIVLATQPASNWVSEHVCTLPAGFRPASLKYFMMTYYGVIGSALDVVLVEILTNGEVRLSHVIRSATSGSSISFIFDHSFVL